MSEGWHPDPLGRYAQRYHDGSGWTSHVSNVGGVTEQDPLGTAPSAPGMTPYEMSDQAPELGSRGLRLLARILDGLLINLPLVLIADAIWNFTDDWVIDVEAEIFEVPIPVEVAVLFVVVSTVYEIFFIGLWGRTIGKMICGLTVVRDDGVTMAGWSPAIIRALVLMLYSQTVVPELATLLLIVTVVMAFATPQRQTLHDKGAQTIVVRSSSLSP